MKRYKNIVVVFFLLFISSFNDILFAYQSNIASDKNRNRKKLLFIVAPSTAMFFYIMYLFVIKNRRSKKDVLIFDDLLPELKIKICGYLSQKNSYNVSCTSNNNYDQLGKLPRLTGYLKAGSLLK